MGAVTAQLSCRREGGCPWQQAEKLTPQVPYACQVLDVGDDDGFEERSFAGMPACCRSDM